jgi:hypothetical protein
MTPTEVVDAVVAAVGILAGTIGIGSGLRALYAILPPRLAPDELGEAVNRGLAWGFLLGMPVATLVFILMLAKGVKS